MVLVQLPWFFAIKFLPARNPEYEYSRGHLRRRDVSVLVLPPSDPRSRGVQAIDLAALQEDWQPASISTKITDNSLARFLLAFIWKQGDFDKVKHVLAGFVGTDGTSAVVLRQFGRHLKSPLMQPIFDQRTARHIMLYSRFGDTTT